jgi:hypothetical protein
MLQMIQKVLGFQIAVRKLKNWKVHQFYRIIYSTKNSSNKKSNNPKLPPICIKKLSTGSLPSVGQEVTQNKFFGTQLAITIHSPSQTL